MEPVDDGTGSSGDQTRKPNSEKKLMTQIPLTIMPCSSAVSLCAAPFTAETLNLTKLKSNPLLHLTVALQGSSILFAGFTLRPVPRIFASLSALRQPPAPQRGVPRRRPNCCQLLLHNVSSAVRERSHVHVGSKHANKRHSGRQPAFPRRSGSRLVPVPRLENNNCSFFAAQQAPGMHSPMYEMLSLPMPVRFPIFLLLVPSKFLTMLREGECCQLRPVALLDCHSRWLTLGLGQRHFRPGFCFSLCVR